MPAYLTLIIAYFIGTLPSALLITKYASGGDIRELGSGNVGAMNSYETTGKKWVGISVFMIDMLKGALAVFISNLISPNDMYAASIAAVFVILGHNYNAFLKFKGGRGLATAVGAILMMNPLGVVIWLLMWAAGYYIIRKDVHTANIVASVASPLMIYNTPDLLLQAAQTYTYSKQIEFQLLYLMVCLVILLRHVEFFKSVIADFKNRNNEE